MILFLYRMYTDRWNLLDFLELELDLDSFFG